MLHSKLLTAKKRYDMKKNIFKGILYTLLSFNMISCSDFLDVDPRSMVSDAAVWGNLGYAEAFQIGRAHV